LLLLTFQVKRCAARRSFAFIDISSKTLCSKENRFSFFFFSNAGSCHVAEFRLSLRQNSAFIYIYDPICCPVNSFSQRMCGLVCSTFIWQILLEKYSNFTYIKACLYYFGINLLLSYVVKTISILSLLTFISFGN
jgi:hypothetical protein